MDLLRPGAVPALIATLCIHAAAAAADCSGLAGTYRNTAVSPKDARLTALVLGKDRARFQRVDRPGSGAQFIPSERITAAKSTNLAARVELMISENGGTRLRIFDEHGQLLVETSIDQPDKWRCEGERLVRSAERMSGVGDDIRVERIDETLERNTRGELVHREARTVIEGKGKARTIEERFAPAPR